MRFTIIPLCFLLFLFSACGGEGDTKNTSLKPAPATTAKEAMRTDNLNLFKAVPKEKSGIDFVNQITETKDFHYF
ncbi:MAG TPA: hypothetical protein ENJ45_00805, partial [Phaeodactylibacter sp.]|nr:hypothetical protein [Phaeodactylibacter sp.]